MNQFSQEKSNFPPTPNSRTPLNHHTQSDSDIDLTLYETFFTQGRRSPGRMRERLGKNFAISLGSTIL